jgi:hypothetical protein
MNTTFKTIAAILAAGLPAAFGAETLGVPLPDVINTAHAFGAFVFAVTLLTLFADYTPRKPLGAAVSVAQPAERKAVLRLAA